MAIDTVDMLKNISLLLLPMLWFPPDETSLKNNVQILVQFLAEVFLLHGDVDLRFAEHRDGFRYKL